VRKASTPSRKPTILRYAAALLAAGLLRRAGGVRQMRRLLDAIEATADQFKRLGERS
jgi:hypothetical protein